MADRVYTEGQRMAALQAASHVTPTYGGNTEKQVEYMTTLAEAFLPWIAGPPEPVDPVITLRREGLLHMHEVATDSNQSVERRLDRVINMLEGLLV